MHDIWHGVKHVELLTLCVCCWDRSLDITFFKSSTDAHMLDLLWNKYWVNTLSASPLISNREFSTGQIGDIAEKLEQAEGQLSHGARMGR